jgi:hypothetical protein
MTTLEVILTVVLWIITAVFLGRRWNKATVSFDMAFPILCLFFAPLVLIGAIIRQVIYEDWK